MEYGTKMVLLKYGRTPRNCIDLHIKQIEQTGLCWFGKIGVAPSISVIRSKIGEGEINVLLYCQDEIYLCRCIDIQNERPLDNYPRYYEDYLYGRGIIPRIYFCLKSIEKIDKNNLSDCVILSSRNNMFDTVKRSMASFFYVEYADPRKEPISHQPVEKAKDSVRRRKEKKIIISPNDCVYREGGVCTNKRCISFQYECIRPSSCAKQKLK